RCRGSRRGTAWRRRPPRAGSRRSSRRCRPARIAVVAGEGEHAAGRRVAGVTRACVPVVADERGPRRARARLARLGAVAEVAVGTRRAVGAQRVLAAGRRGAGVESARVAVVAWSGGGHDVEGVEPPTRRRAEGLRGPRGARSAATWGRAPTRGASPSRPPEAPPVDNVAGAHLGAELRGSPAR